MAKYKKFSSRVKRARAERLKALGMAIAVPLVPAIMAGAAYLGIMLGQSFL